MSLTAWEQQALDSIKDGLASSDPTLVARLAIFTRLVSDEEMPVREKIRASSRPAARPARDGQRRARRGWRHRGLQQTVLLLWLVTTVAMIAVALACNRVGGHGTCTGPWATLCTGASSAPRSASSLP